MQRLIIAICRAIAWNRMRILEVELHDLNEALHYIGGPEAHLQIDLARIRTQRELAKARADYIALLPPGKRLTFLVA